MINNLATELVLTITEFLNFYDVEQLAWINRRFMQIVKRNFPLALEPKIRISSITFSQVQEQIFLELNAK